MALSKIEWTDFTFNSWIGCTKVSPGCDNCYAEKGSARLGAMHKLKLWEGDRYRTGTKYWAQPERWDRAAAKAGKRARVFCASFADVFEDRLELEQRRADLLRLITRTPNLDWLLLTKRPENMLRMTDAVWGNAGWPSNAWAGTTCENQEWANKRIPHLLKVPASVRFVSYEPALGPIDFTHIESSEYLSPSGEHHIDALRGVVNGGPWLLRSVNWVIVGGESGPGARPLDLQRARSTVEQCKAAGVACFVKQMGARPIDAGYALDYGRKGDDMSEWPEELQVREWPR